MADAYDRIVKRLAFLLDPEVAHNIGLKLIERGIATGGMFTMDLLTTEVFGTRFQNPLGLAAGFDKNAVALANWAKLGFGFVEVGTVTFNPQPGNDKPRMFRYPSQEAIINRLGFNNLGALAMAEKLANNSANLPFGINLGKNKEVPPEEAAENYAASYRALHTFGTYFVINVSSPNTPGLRDLQDRDSLEQILKALAAIDSSRPILIKVAPDLEWSALDQVISVVADSQATGIVATNTTLSRAGLPAAEYPAGGMSGKPLRELSLSFTKYLAQNLPKDKILISVGGISTGDDLYERFRAGAHLCQVYSGFVYGGPGWPTRVLADLGNRMKREGISSLAELRTSA